MDGQWVDLAGFRAGVSSSFVPLEVTAPDPGAFRGQVVQQVVDGVTFSCVTARPHTVHRTPALIERSPRHYFKISLQMQGSSDLDQNGRSITLAPGDLAIYNTSRPYTLTFGEPFQVMVVMLPHSRFDLPAGLVDQMTAVRLAGNEGLGTIVSPFLAQIGANLEHLAGPAGSALAHNAVELLQTLFTNHMDLARTAATPHLSQVMTIREHIDGHLADPDLGPASIAAANYISTRHLHSLFREQGITVGGYVRSRRLERCHRDLVDPGQADVPVSVIGARWGFPDAAHFSRTFKAAYGQSPSALRGRPATA